MKNCDARNPYSGNKKTKFKERKTNTVKDEKTIKTNNARANSMHESGL